MVVASHDRPLRLRWLLNALEAQTLDTSRWEVVVCHDSKGRETDELLAGHTLTRLGVLKGMRHAPSTAGAKRNAAVGLARGATVVFTDDDCRPPEQWLEHVLRAVHEHPAAIVQGPVQGDPDENVMRRSPYPRSQVFDDVPRPWAECCNIAYPRELLVAIGGFAEDVHSAEDTDLNIRAQAAGARFLGDQQMLSYHAIEDGSVLSWIRASRRWCDVPWLFKRHPAFRRELEHHVFWNRAHMLLPLAIVGLGLAARNRAWLGLVAPWAVQRSPGRSGIRGRTRDLLELPGWALVDVAEMIALGRGSIRHRALVL